jgi:homoserine kinase
MGPGFDVHSIALQAPEIEVELSTAPRDSRTIQIEGRYAEEVTTDPKLNAAGKALNAMREQFGKPEGYALKIEANIPPRKGLGLSGAEAVGVVFCANHMFKLGLKRETVAHIAAEAEPSHHMDNVSASALGGFNIVTRTPLDKYEEITSMPPPKDLGVAVLVPDIEKNSTEATRQLLPVEVPREQYVQSMSYAARISVAFATGNVGAILKTLPWDLVVEPARSDGGAYGKGVDSKFLLEEKKLLLEKFHVAETISGAGPSRALWYSISEERKTRSTNKVGVIRPAINLVSERLKSLGYGVREVFLTKPSSQGATIL